MALMAVACGDGSTGTTSTAVVTTEAGPGSTAPGGSPLVLSEVDFDAGVVVILNAGSTDYDVGGHFLCNRPSYVEVPGGILAPGESVSVGLAGLSVDVDDGEVGLYTARAFSDSSAIIRYVQWGADAHGRTATAVAAGVWVSGDTVANNGASLIAIGPNPISAADWSTG
jgi:hypothetical protein